MARHALWGALNCRQVLLCAAVAAPAAWYALAWVLRKPKRRPTGFEAFLKIDKNAETQRSPANFSCFLRNADRTQATAVVVDVGAAPAVSAAAGPREGDAAVLVLFGTEYGASREISEKLCERMRAAGPYWSALLQAATSALYAQQRASSLLTTKHRTTGRACWIWRSTQKGLISAAKPLFWWCARLRRACINLPEQLNTAQSSDTWRTAGRWRAAQ